MEMLQQQQELGYRDQWERDDGVETRWIDISCVAAPVAATTNDCVGKFRAPHKLA